jgi:hypothetical protein
MANYRACLVDDNLNQITRWRYLDEGGYVEWEPNEVYPLRYGTMVRRYLVHDTLTDALGVCWTDAIGYLNLGDRVTLQVRPQSRSTYD